MLAFGVEGAAGWCCVVGPGTDTLIGFGLAMGAGDALRSVSLAVLDLGESQTDGCSAGFVGAGRFVA